MKKKYTPAQIYALAVVTPVRRVKNGRESILQPHIEAIRYMRQRRMNYREIHRFFTKDVGIKCTYQNILHFAKANKIGQ